MRALDRHAAGFTIALFILGWSATTGFGGQEPHRFVVRADAVRVDVLVTDGRRLVSGLRADDFEVRDDGVVQRIDEIEVAQLPLNLISVFDTSSSVAGERLRQLREAGRQLLAGLQPGDRAALLSFANRVRLLAPLSDDRASIGAALEIMRAANRTSLRDGVFAGLAIREEDRGRTLLLLFSDGQDTASWLTRHSVLEAAKRTDVVVYAVAVKAPSGRHGRFLDDLAAETGGRVVVADSDRDLQPTFKQILAEFRTRYVLTYQPAGVPRTGWHRIDVKLKKKRGSVVARRGYVLE